MWVKRRCKLLQLGESIFLIPRTTADELARRVGYFRGGNGITANIAHKMSANVFSMRRK